MIAVRDFCLHQTLGMSFWNSASALSKAQSQFNEEQPWETDKLCFSGSDIIHNEVFVRTTLINDVNYGDHPDINNLYSIRQASACISAEAD